MVDIPTPIEVCKIKGSVQIIEGLNVANKVVLTKPNIEMAYHLKLLFMQGHLNGIPLTRMMVDNGAAVNILLARMMKRMGKTTEDLAPMDIVVH
ncbi:hypothetical protein ACH5RR_023628 [Cinchona calisaya]|uniref:Uncharacterized protein n=1 Tax=Cinchona calisaya TaxID=153742 RepID=A0ABD2ZB79_9GENT